MSVRARGVRQGKAGGPTRRRVHQGTVDLMADLRRQGYTFKAIAEKVGCGERTARRFAGNVRPQLHLPQDRPELDTDPRALREQLLTEFVHLLHRDETLRSLTMTWHSAGRDEFRAEYGGPPSILFLSEAEGQLRARLERLGVNALRLLASDLRSKLRFMREVIGDLYHDYASWHRFAQNFGAFDTGEDWRPPGERPPVPHINPEDFEDPFGILDEGP